MLSRRDKLELVEITLKSEISSNRRDALGYIAVLALAVVVLLILLSVPTIFLYILALPLVYTTYIEIVGLLRCRRTHLTLKGDLQWVQDELAWETSEPTQWGIVT